MNSDRNSAIRGEESLSSEAYFDKSTEAGKKANISMTGVRPGYFCKMAAIFMPEVNEIYEASFVWDSPDITRVSCYIEINTLEMSVSQLIRIKKLARKKDKVCSNNIF